MTGYSLELLAAAIVVASALISLTYWFATQKLKSQFKVLTAKLDQWMETVQGSVRRNRAQVDWAHKRIDDLEQRKVDKENCQDARESLEDRFDDFNLEEEGD